MLSAARVLGRKAVECSNVAYDIGGAKKFSQLLNSVSIICNFRTRRILLF